MTPLLKQTNNIYVIPWLQYFILILYEKCKKYVTTIFSEKSYQKISVVPHLSRLSQVIIMLLVATIFHIALWLKHKSIYMNMKTKYVVL